MYYSRGCECHRARDVDADNLQSYMKRRKAYEDSSRTSKPCLAKGLHGRIFFCGKAMQILRDAYKKFSSMLLCELAHVSPDARHRLMSDFDLGVDQSMYIVHVTFAVHEQLPLLLCGLCNIDPDQAKM